MADQINVNTKSLAVTTGGEHSSEDMSQFSRSVAEDLQNLAKQGNVTSTEVVSTAAILSDEMNHLRTSVSALEKSQDFRERESTTLVKTLDFFSKKDVSYADGTPESNKLTVSSRYGQVHLPNNSTTPRFFLEDPKTGKITANPNLSPQVIGGEPSTPGFIPSIKEGVIKNAFNGYNGSYWKRSVSYPLEAPVESVSATINVKVPVTSSTDLELSKLFNVVSVNPFPLGRIDVDHIWYRTSDGAPWSILPTYPREFDAGAGALVASSVKDADHLQYTISPIKASEFQIKLTQRNWVEEDNQKVFHLGLQEFSVKYVEFLGKSTTYGANLEDTHHVIFKVTSPESTKFQSLSKLDISPDPKKEGTGKDDNHIVYALSTSESLDDAFWWSNTSVVPVPGVTSPVSLIDIDEYYVIIQMRYAHEVIANSPYLPKTSPVVDHVSMSHVLVPVVEGEAAEPQIDWTARNASQHFNNQIMMDVMKETANDGSNMVLVWDDFWDDATWGSATRSDVTNLTIDPERMALTTASDVGGAGSNGTVTYVAVPGSGNWGDAGDYEWIPSRFWFQHTSSVPSGSVVKFFLNYSTSGGTQTPVEITPGEWTNFPTVGGTVQKMWVSVELENTFGGGASGQPKVYQIAMLVKD